MYFDWFDYLFLPFLKFMFFYYCLLLLYLVCVGGCKIYATSASGFTILASAVLSEVDADYRGSGGFMGGS